MRKPIGLLAVAAAVTLNAGTSAAGHASRCLPERPGVPGLLLSQWGYANTSTEEDLAIYCPLQARGAARPSLRRMRVMFFDRSAERNVVCRRVGMLDDGGDFEDAAQSSAGDALNANWLEFPAVATHGRGQFALRCVIPRRQPDGAYPAGFESAVTTILED